MERIRTRLGKPHRRTKHLSGHHARNRGLAGASPPTTLPPEMETVRDERWKQVAIAAAILGGVFVLSLGIRLLSFIPGFVGEFFGIVTGVLATPVFLEVSFFIVGFLIVLALNHWNMKRDGDEYVYLDRIQEKDLPTGIPAQAKYAIYKNPPLLGEEPSLLVQAEGAFEIGDFQNAAEILGSMSSDELHTPAATDLRIKLARATGKDDLARHLEAER